MRKYIILIPVIFLVVLFFGFNNVENSDPKNVHDEKAEYKAVAENTQEIKTSSSKGEISIFQTAGFTMPPDDNLGRLPLQGTKSFDVKNVNLPEGQVKLPILMYHYIRPLNPKMTELDRGLSLTPEEFDAQMIYLNENGFTTVFPDEMMDALDGKSVLPKKPIMLTFDDGYEDFYTNAFPIIKKYNIKAVSFLIVNYIGTNRYMTEAQILEINKSGLVDFESHSMSHPFLTRVDKERLKKEVVDSKAALEKLLGKKINYFCYPYGDLNYTSVVAAVQEAGYRSAFTVYYGYVHRKEFPFIQDRVRSSYKDTISAFARRIEIF
ncbi:MAG: hypothetical protein US89_C0004G0082 [Candidatus Peregrinibacteria bacterium GW2011_GWF2_38_29]|nr:MAG: hypothetical protein US89_C0004G0082 [Candidatus Peregrinibacteria bacterium GW2011_GWF2_38_29]HBB03018.1 hypothetical protein [Candidatus Peregrinibacteria bacterium]